MFKGLTPRQLMTRVAIVLVCAGVFGTLGTLAVNRVITAITDTEVTVQVTDPFSYGAIDVADPYVTVDVKGDAGLFERGDSVRIRFMWPCNTCDDFSNWDDTGYAIAVANREAAFLQKGRCYTLALTGFGKEAEFDSEAFDPKEVPCSP